MQDFKNLSRIIYKSTVCCEFTISGDDLAIEEYMFDQLRHSFSQQMLEFHPSKYPGSTAA